MNIYFVFCICLCILCHNSYSHELKRKKIEKLAKLLQNQVFRLQTSEFLDLVFLLDSSASVGQDNFLNEIKFIKKFLTNFTISLENTRIAVITFSSMDRVKKQVDFITKLSSENHKCYLFSSQLPSIQYYSGGTYTFGALVQASEVLKFARKNAQKAVFLITDGYSNGGDPVPEARRLKDSHVEIFTIGIKNGNLKELRALCSKPIKEHNFILESFKSLDSLGRRAFYTDFSRDYIMAVNSSFCSHSCSSLATCGCNSQSGRSFCFCPLGHYGNQCKPCPPGTYKDKATTKSCTRCPFQNSTSSPGSTHVNFCKCAPGFVRDKQGCSPNSCPILKSPAHGYIVQNCSNTYHSICEIRCNEGYSLFDGSASRTCTSDGSWSGDEPNCKENKCRALKTPRNGIMKCESEKDSFMSRCSFSCRRGYQIIGSQKRICLSMSLWSGLPSYCKPILCSPLTKPKYGNIYPDKCWTYNNSYGQRCAYTCHYGFKMIGSPLQTCIMPGIWDIDSTQTKCVDVTPPLLKCPKNVRLSTAQGLHYITYNVSLPIATDNSGFKPDILSIPVVLPNMKFRIGRTKIKFSAIDWSGNVAKCSMNIDVMDDENPIVEYCPTPPVYLTKKNYERIEWDEPIFSDNSLEDLKVIQSHNFGIFPLGTTIISYTAYDESQNSATCNMSLTLQQHSCALPLPPSNGERICEFHDSKAHCALVCQEGYSFPLETQIDYDCDSETIETNVIVSSSDCSLASSPLEMISKVNLTFTHSELSNSSVVMSPCQNPFLLSEISEYLQKHLSNALNELCGNDLYCNVEKIDSTCKDLLSTSRKIRDTWQKSHHELEIQLSWKNTKINETHNSIIWTSLDSILKRKLKTEWRNTQANNSLSYNLNYTQMSQESLSFQCSLGTVLSGNNRCVNCPIGTFFDVKTKKCVPCFKNTFQNAERQFSCLPCPVNTYTIGNKGGKRLRDCKDPCFPGFFSQNGLRPCQKCTKGSYSLNKGSKRCLRCPSGFTTINGFQNNTESCIKRCESGTVSENGLAPCLPCPKGYFQHKKGQRKCISCLKRQDNQNCQSLKVFDKFPYNNVSDLFVNDCFSEPCLQGSTCVALDRGFSCICQRGFKGALCNEINNTCHFNPCENGGSCIFNLEMETLYICNCLKGFEGRHCEVDVNECAVKPCSKYGRCVNEYGSYRCLCDSGYSGLHCMHNNNDCLHHYCQHNGTCKDSIDSYTCTCQIGYSGHFCEIQEDEIVKESCDKTKCLNAGTCHSNEWKPAHCICVKGFTGKYCETPSQETECSRKCQNDGKCELEQCNCPSYFYGEHCERPWMKNYILHFLENNNEDFALSSKTLKELNQLSFCFWMKTSDKENYGTPFSYATESQDNEFTFTDYNGFVLFIKGHKIVSDVVGNDNQWHFLCGSWNSFGGLWKLYKDGIEVDSGEDLATGLTITSNGRFIVGQEQDSLSDNYSSSEYFKGLISSLNIYDVVLNSSEIQILFRSCETVFDPIISWQNFQEGLIGSITIEEQIHCGLCNLPELFQDGKIHLQNGLATYICNSGFELSGPITNNSCGAFGIWSPSSFPSCQMSLKDNVLTEEKNNTLELCSSDLPTIENGKPIETEISLKSRRGERLNYICDFGFEFENEDYILCLQNGSWSTTNIPKCKPLDCESLQMNYPFSDLTSSPSSQTLGFDSLRIRNFLQMSKRLLCFRKTNAPMFKFWNMETSNISLYSKTLLESEDVSGEK